MSEASTGNVIEKVNYTHKAVIDAIVADPSITQRDLASMFGYTEGWMSQVIRSDAFQEMLAARKDELFDPAILHGLEKRMEALAHQSLDVLQENLQIKRSADVAYKALELTTRALGFGAKAAGPQIQQTFVVQMPQKSVSGDDWVREHKPQPDKIGGLGGGLGQGNMARLINLDTVIEVPLG